MNSKALPSLEVVLLLRSAFSKLRSAFSKLRSIMARMAPTPPSVVADCEKSSEEEDLLRRSKKKVRAWDEVDGSGSLVQEMVPPPASQPETGSYKDKLLNLFGEAIPEKLDAKAMQELFAIEVPDGPENADTTKPSCPEIPLSDEEWNEWSQPWRKTLVAKLLGKMINFKSLETNIRHRWARKGSIKIVDMADGYYLVYFATEEDYNFALFEGSWMIADHYLIVQRWQPFFLQSAENSNKIAVWLRIPKLPLELYNAKFLWRIGTTLGTPLRIQGVSTLVFALRLILRCHCHPTL